MSLPGKLLGLGDQTHGDQEKDANSLLMELDKGIFDILIMIVVQSQVM